jgi:hypothetical protein
MGALVHIPDTKHYIAHTVQHTDIRGTGFQDWTAGSLGHVLDAGWGAAGTAGVTDPAKIYRSVTLASLEGLGHWFS